MKKQIILSSLVMIFMIVAVQLNASVWRVNAAPGASAHYTTLQAAHDAVTTLNGDTIYLEGSAFSTGGLDCNKQLVILGSGYFLNENPQTQANVNPSTIDYYLNFNINSSGSKVMGCRFTYPTYIYASNITIERNYFVGVNVYGYGTTMNNIKILRNYFQNSYYYNSINFPNTATNVLISNNYIGGAFSTGANFEGFITNNIFEGYITFYNATFTNNISTYDYFYPYNSVFTYNIGNGTQFGTANGNQQNVTMANVFVGATGYTTDSKWQLKAGSPAIGGGEGGVDCGMFAGSYPYILSGMPPIPAVYYYNAPGLPTNSINVSIKAKSHN
jgi:hypothetical protein